MDDGHCGHCEYMSPYDSFSCLSFTIFAKSKTNKKPTRITGVVLSCNGKNALNPTWNKAIT